MVDLPYFAGPLCTGKGCHFPVIKLESPIVNSVGGKQVRNLGLALASSEC
jgi:hypothetical protein